MKGATGYAFAAAPLILGAVIWLAVGVPYNLLWVFGLMVAVGGLLLWKAQKSQDHETRERGDSFLERLENRPPE